MDGVDVVVTVRVTGVPFQRANMCESTQRP